MRTNLPKSPAGRFLAAVVTAISLVFIAVAQRDLSARSDDEIRGQKRVWRLVCLNGLGALAYLRFGRRDATV